MQQLTYDEALELVPKKMQRLIERLDQVNIWVGKAAAWLCVPMVYSLMHEVTARYFFTAPTVWASELSVLIFGVMFMLASPWCLRDGGHVRTDFFYHNWSVRVKAISDIAHYVLLFYPAHILFMQLSWNYFWKSYIHDEVSVTSPWMPIIWPVKMAIPIYVALTMVQGLSEILKCVYRYKTNVDLWSVHEELESIDVNAPEKSTTIKGA